MFKELDEVSVKRMQGVHPDLRKLADYAAGVSPVPFVITCGLRTLEEQKKLVAAGKSRTMKSRHLTGHAIDVAARIDGKINWDLPNYRKIADAFKEASKALGIPVEWGGDWKSFIDGPHFQLPHGEYPA